MTKKIIALIVVALAFLGWFVYQAYNKNDSEIVMDTDARPSGSDSKIPSSLKVSETTIVKAVENGAIVENKKIPNDQDGNFEIFDQMEKSWLQKSKKIMGEEKHILYVDMRNRSEKEKMQAYKEYHDYLKQKYGDKFSYSISDDQSQRERQITVKYLKELLKLIGAEKYKQYVQARDQYNEEIRRSNKASIQIEF